MTYSYSNAPILASFFVVAVFGSCGGSSTVSGTASPATQTDLTIVSISVSDGDTWQVNRPVDIEFDRPIDFNSVVPSTVFFRSSLGTFATGILAPSPGPGGTQLLNVIRFQPNCPMQTDGSDSGFSPGGLIYTMTVAGSDAPGGGIQAVDGRALPQTQLTTFFSASETSPGGLFYDTFPGAPKARVRGLNGVSLLDPRANFLEIASAPEGISYFQYDLQTQVAGIDPAHIPGGLPLNHYAIASNQSAFVFHFDQPLFPSQTNIDRIGVEYLEGVWKPLQGQAKLLSNCIDPGIAVRFTPVGLLPRGTPLRLRVAGGLDDLALNSLNTPLLGIGSLSTTQSASVIGLALDAYQESFGVGGNGPGSTQDMDVNFGVPHALWGQGRLVPTGDAAGESKARSRWIPLGLGHIYPGQGDVPPLFRSDGTDANGDLLVNGTQVLPGTLASAPITIQNIETKAVTILKADLASLDPIYLAQPALLWGAHAVMPPSGTGNSPARGLTVRGVQDAGGSIRLIFSETCVDIPGSDCVPLDLVAAHGTGPGVTVTLIPQSLEMLAAFAYDMLPPDTAVRILFDATVADGAGDPDTSMTAGWTADISTLSGTLWDFVRFQVEFDLDVSNDGWDVQAPRPTLLFLSLIFDQRP